MKNLIAMLMVGGVLAVVASGCSPAATTEPIKTTTHAKDMAAKKHSAGPLPSMNLSAYQAQRPPDGASISNCLCKMRRDVDGSYVIVMREVDAINNVIFATETVRIFPDDPDAARDVIDALKGGTEGYCNLEIRPSPGHDWSVAIRLAK